MSQEANEQFGSSSFLDESPKKQLKSSSKKSLQNSTKKSSQNSAEKASEQKSAEKVEPSLRNETDLTAPVPETPNFPEHEVSEKKDKSPTPSKHDTQPQEENETQPHEENDVQPKERNATQPQEGSDSQPSDQPQKKGIFKKEKSFISANIPVPSTTKDEESPAVDSHHLSPSNTGDSSEKEKENRQEAPDQKANKGEIAFRLKKDKSKRKSNDSHRSRSIKRTQQGDNAEGSPKPNTNLPKLQSLKQKVPFDLTGLIHSRMSEYDSLKDSNLQFHFCSQVRRRHLKKMGLITAGDGIVNNSVRNVKHSPPRKILEAHSQVTAGQFFPGDVMPKSPYEEDLFCTTYKKQHPYLSQK